MQQTMASHPIEYTHVKLTPYTPKLTLNIDGIAAN